MKAFTILRFELSPTVKGDKGSTIFVAPDPLIAGVLVAQCDPTFCKLPPDTAVRELNLAFADYEFRKEK